MKKSIVSTRTCDDQNDNHRSNGEGIDIIDEKDEKNRKKRHI